MTHNTITKSPEEQLIRENEILSKIVLEIMLRFSEKVSWSWKEKRTDERIKEILSQPDWKEKTQFIAKDHKGDECIGHWWSAPWLVDAREPIEIIERLNKEKEEAITHLTNYYSEQLENKDTEISELEESNNWLQKELKEAWSAEDTHIEVMQYVGKLAEEQHDKETKNLKEKLADKEETLNKERQEHDKQAKSLRGEVKEKTQMLQKSDKMLEEEMAKNAKLQEESEEKSKMLAKSEEREERLNRQLYLERKPLPPLPKKQNKFQKLGKKINSKFQKLHQLLEKKKHQVQEFTAQIEVKAN